jgi:hypothetical protein
MLNRLLEYQKENQGKLEFAKDHLVRKERSFVTMPVKDYEAVTLAFNEFY